MRPTSVQKLAEFLRQPPLILGLLGLALIVPLASFADAPDNLTSAPVVQTEPEVAPGEILVKFEADISSQAI